MPKNIVICSDGTGNSGGKGRGTNVWRIFNALDRYGGTRQVAHYDDGVGTQRLRWLRLLGGAFGWGLGRNIREAYEFLAMNYEDGDRVFLFGYSRGAFTVRSLAGMVDRCGLLPYPGDACGLREWCRGVKRVFKAYRVKQSLLERKLGKRTEDDFGSRVRALEIDDLGTGRWLLLPRPAHLSRSGVGNRRLGHPVHSHSFRWRLGHGGRGRRSVRRTQGLDQARGPRLEPMALHSTALVLQ